MEHWVTKYLKWASVVGLRMAPPQDVTQENRHQVHAEGWLFDQNMGCEGVPKETHSEQQRTPIKHEAGLNQVWSILPVSAQSEDIDIVAKVKQEVV